MAESMQLNRNYFWAKYPQRCFPISVLRNAYKNLKKIGHIKDVKNICWVVRKVISLFQEKMKVDLFIHGIHILFGYISMTSEMPVVIKWNNLAVRSSVKYKETRQNEIHNIKNEMTPINPIFLIIIMPKSYQKTPKTKHNCFMNN